ncbi:selenocysteine-specific translation elongation factor [Paraburkholderia fungorum]|uniref:Selenocysteine-specific elongation factor n=1 Tax=Paraburkholderia fungorum TaxID=134537 RepID=A0AAW3UQ33_9BURK|nr:selenocysteine-specific translation elongation factor [Paraburkholderia fungorum]MBB4512644.1 selenocysteine-specific elongation factor [Paraburkholderia fungorum]MBB6200549.1 selenocysteine-specific elongation factor [Paraburkholderia fungorum]MBU7437786.1 selenocysteine-specific translation elongation factor [Paraburkholderia fungorum]
MIVGTAGHIDHGKTSLVRALSGVDTDRLKEEKARGISIELGYAYVPLDNGDVLGLIDVPGHEKLVHTMTAGASGIDFALLVIAADDGVMPQTREHLAIVELLGIKRGAVALTKIDRVDAVRLKEVHDEVTAFLSGSVLQDASVFETNALHDDDAGVAALKAHLHAAAAEWRMKRDDGLFRLAVDRVFTLTGQGTIVTGTVVSGRVTVGDTMLLAPKNQPVRVRSIHAQNRPAGSGRAGERCALNLAGIEKSAIDRGDWIVDPRLSQASERIDVMLTLLADAPLTLEHWAPLHVHLGTQHQVAHVALLDGERLGAGQSARVQLVFERPVCALPGDRFVVRNAQADRTVGGGHVLDPFAPSRKRRSAERLAWLNAIRTMLDSGELDSLLAKAPFGLSRSLLERLTGMPAAMLALPSDTRVVELVGHDALLIADASWRALNTRLTTTLKQYHERSPDELGPDGSRLRRMAAPLVDDALWRALIDEAAARGEIVKRGPWLHLPDHAVTLDEADRALAATLLRALKEGRFDPPWVRDLANAHGVSEDRVRQLLRKLARQGELFQVVRDLFYHHEVIRELASIASSEAQKNAGTVAAAPFRDVTGLGRKRAIQLLEFFDRVGYTRFHRGLHLMRTDTRWLDLL